MQNKIIGVAVFAASTLLFISTASATVIPVVAPAPAPCDVVGTPFLTITHDITNDADSGVHGDWATDAFTETVNVWVGTDGATYCASANTTNGTFVTTGPLSPEAGVALSAGITGTFTGGENYTFPSSLALNASYSTTSPQTIPIPASSTDGFSSWVAQVFPSVAASDGSSYVKTYSLTYVTAANGTWTDADGSVGIGSGGDIGDIIDEAPCSTAGIGSPLLINVTQQISNDPDSGTFGGDWAIDNFIRHIQVWQEGTHYCAEADDNGTFTTFGGATGKSPQTGAALPEVVTGTMIGGTHGEISGATAQIDVANWGITGTTSVAENCGGTDCSMTAAWVSNYFGSDAYDYSNGWGWTYNGGANGTWTNASTGSGGDITHITPPTVTTEAATGISSSDATMNGFNGDGAAATHSFWVSTSTFSTATTNIPDGVYSTPGTGAVAADTAFSDTLSSVTVDGVTTGGAPVPLPAITPDTTYYYVAWTNVGNNWYPGSELSFTTLAVHTLSYTAGAGGSLTGSTSQTVDNGTDGTAVTAVANAGFHFTSWSDGSTTASRTDTDVTADVNVTASFVADSDLTALNAEIVAAQADVTGAVVGTHPGDYAQSSIDTLNAAITVAQSITDTDDQSVVDAADVTLTAAVTAFEASVVPPSDLTALNAAVASADALIAADAPESLTPGDHTIGARATLIVALSNVSADSTDDQSVVDGQTATLNAAIAAYNAAIVPPSDLTALSAEITIAHGDVSAAVVGTEPGNYPQSSVDALNAAIATAQLVTSGESQILVDAAETSLAASVTAFNATALPADHTPPVIAFHADVNASAVSASGANVSYTSPATTDNDDAPGVASCLPASGSLFALGSTLVTCNASDSSGNAATATTFNVIVKDTTAPTIAASSPIVAEAASSTGAIIVYAAPATSDNVDAAGVATCSPLSHTTFSIGSHTVTCNATDASGNHAIQTSFSVTVHDTTGPVITSHADMTVEATSSLGSLVTYTKPTATDTVDGTDAVSCVPASGSQFALGATTVNCSATDAAHNTSTSHFTVHVTDTTAPVITLNGSATVGLTVGGTYTELGATATDAVDGTDTVTIAGDTVNTAAIGTYVVTYDAVDAAGNHATQVTRTVTVSAAPVVPVTPPATSGGGGGGGNGPIAGGGGGGFSGPVSALLNNGSTATSTTGNTGGQVLGASVYEFLVDFGVGTQDTDVTQLQTILKADGFFSGPIIGSFGPMTKAAVIKFQIANHINPTGYVGPLTRAVLNKGTTPTLLQELESQLAALMAQLAALKAATSTSATSTIQ